MSGFHYRPGIEAVPGYTLQKMLGRGGFGEVWRAEGPGRIPVAVKIIDKVDDKAGRKEFRALKLIKDLRHPNLISISGFWLKDAEGKFLDPDLLTDDPDASDTKPSELVIVMDLGEKSLLERLEECRKNLKEQEKGGIPPDELLEYMDAAAKAIDYLNIRHDIQHRDIKPQNILIVGGSAQVCDFGLASAVSSVRTSMGGAGSLAYMAPEIYSTKRPSKSTDQYGLAVAYVELRTGRLPLADLESYACLDEAKRKGNLDLSWLDDAERSVIERGAALNPEQRFASCVEFIKALRQAARGEASVLITRDTLRPFGDYLPRKRLHRRGGEEIWEATAAEGHTVQLVVRDAAESPDLIHREAIATVRDASRRHDNLSELYEVVRLNDEGRVLPARLFENANPPTFAKLALVGQHSATTLNDRIVPGGLPARQILPLFDQLARAIDFLNAPEHEDRGRKVSIVHGHLRPVNVQVDGGMVRLCNFSGAQLLAGDQHEAPQLAQVPEGPYTPPEFLQGRVTRWSDQYLLAVAYLQLRTGKPSSGLAGSTGSSGSTGSAGSLAARPKLELSGLNAAEQEVLARATDESPQNRFPDAASLVQSLREAVGASVVEPPPTDRGEPDRSEGFGRSTPRDRIGAETIQQSDVMVAPRLQGTLQQPALGETLIQHDTDRGEWERKSAPQTAASMPLAQSGVPLTQASGVPLAPPVQPVPRRRSLARPFALSAAGAALIAAAVFLGMKTFKTGEHPTFDDPVDQAVHQKILSGQFEDALREIDSAGAALAEARREQLRLEVSQGWFQQNVKPHVDRGEVAKALTTLEGPVPPFIADEIRGNWRDSITAAWYGEADRQLKAKKFAEAAVLFNQIIARLGSFQDALRLRGEALDNLARLAQSQLDSDTPAAVANLSAIIQAVDGAEKITTIPRPPDVTLRQRALLQRARAYARVKNWTKAADDIKQLPTKLETPRDTAHHEIIRLLANDKTASLLDARRVRDEVASAADPWEKKSLDGLLDRLTRAGEGQQQQRFAKAITEAETLTKAGKFADAARILDAIAKDPEQKAIADASGQQDYDELRALVLVGRTDGAPGEIKKRVEQGVDLIEDRIFNNAASRGRLVPLSRGLVQRAIEPAAANSRERKHPALLVPAARVVAKAITHVKPDSPEAKDLAELSDDLQTALADDVRRLRDATAGKPPAADNPAWTALLDLCKAAGDLGLNSRLAQAVLLESAIARKAPAAETAKIHAALKEPDSTSPDEPFVRYVLALADARSDQPVAASAHLLAAYQNIFPPGTLDCKLPQEIKNAEAWQRDPRRARRAAEILLAAGLAERTGPDDDPTLGQNADRNRYTPEAAAKILPALALAHTLVVLGQPDMRNETDARLVHDIREHQALAAGYNPATAMNVGRERLERFIEQFPETTSTQIWITHAAIHEKSFDDTKNVADRNRVLRSLGALYRVAEAKSVSPLTIYDRVIERGFALLASADPATEQLDPGTRSASAALCAARGRYIMLFPSIEEKFAQKSPDQVAYDSYDRAIKFYDGAATHYIGRGLAANNLADLPANEVARRLMDNATAAAGRAELPIEKLWARGLRGLASLQESIWVADRAEKIKKLNAAIDDFNIVEKSTVQDTTARESDEYQLFLLARGGAHLKIASYLPTKEDKEKHLTAAVAVAEQITKEYGRRRHPEWAYFLWGNADEDHGLFLGDAKGYERAVEHFGRAYTEADQQNDAKGRSVALFNRGRCRYRLVADVLAPLSQTVIVNKQPAIQELNRSIDDLTKSIDTANKGKWDLRQAEANRWLAHAFQHPLVADPERAARHLDDAARLAKAKNPSWPFYEILRAEHALTRARAPADPKTFDRVSAKRFIDQAAAAAKAVLDDAKDPRVDARHRVQAALVLLQGDLWLGDVAAARKQFEDAGKRVAGDDRFDLSLGVAEKLLDKPGVNDPRRPMSEDEADLARVALLAAKSALEKAPAGAKDRLAEVNMNHYKYWQIYLNPAYERYRTARDNKRQLLDLLHHARFHVAMGLSLKENADTRNALRTYTAFILEGETDWNKPGRDQAQYRRDAGL